MRIRVEIGNPETEEWDFFSYIELPPYLRIYEKKFPNLPPFPGIDDCYSIEDHEVGIHGITTIEISATHSVEKGSIYIIVKHEGQSFVQVGGAAFSIENVGLSLLFEVPGTKVPVNLICAP